MFADQDKDLGFLLSLVEEFCGDEAVPLLEFASGTGRVTTQVARLGYDVIGVDFSEVMLNAARAKIDGIQWYPNSGVIELFNGDMRDYRTQYCGEHVLVLVPFSSFLHMMSFQDQVAALKNFWVHLEDGGHLMADILNPQMRDYIHGMGESHPPERDARIPLEDGKTLIRSVASEYQATSQHVRWTYEAKVYDQQRNLEHSYMEEVNLRIIFPNEWRMLLHLAGFTIVSEWGDYDKSPFTDSSPRMLFLAEKTHPPLI